MCQSCGQLDWVILVNSCVEFPHSLYIHHDRGQQGQNAAQNGFGKSGDAHLGNDVRLMVGRRGEPFIERGAGRGANERKEAAHRPGANGSTELILCLNIFNENPEHINLKVMGQDGNVVQFKIKRHTALKKLMSTYCERAGLALQTIRFSFNGTRINESDTPKGLDMEDGDTIEVFQQQSGGGSSQVTATQGGGCLIISTAEGGTRKQAHNSVCSI